MTNQDVVDAMVEWLVAVCPELSSYDHAPAAKTQALPDVVCDLAQERTVRDDPDFPLMQLQQVGLRRFDVAFSFMVEAGVDEAGSQAAQQQLRTFAERLTLAVLDDATLGGRVPLASPTTLLFDYSLPFVDYEDGTRGRELRGELAVADPLIGAGGLDAGPFS